MAMSAVFRTDKAPGPAGRWLIERLKSNGAPDRVSRNVRPARRNRPEKAVP
jgi:hypothetical protein